MGQGSVRTSEEICGLLLRQLAYVSTRAHICVHTRAHARTQPRPPHEAPGSESTSPALLTVLTWETGFPPDA